MKKAITLALLYVFFNFAQVNPVVNDFLISGKDNNPSTFTQSYPQLFYTNSDKFIVSWTDYREGNPAIYAQKFNKDGSKSGKNFRIKGNGNTYVNRNGYTLSLNTISTNDHFFSYTNTDASLYNQDDEIINSGYLYGSGSPWCGTGFIYGEEIVSSSDNSFYFLNNYAGFVTLRKIEQSGEFKSINLPPETETYISQIAAAATTDENYFFAWIKGLSSIDDSLQAGLYATFINGKDSVIKSAVLISGVKNSEFEGELIENYWLKAITVNDSIYRIYWINNSGGSLKFLSFNINGNIISPVDSILIPPVHGNSLISNFNISNVTEEEGYFIFITLESLAYPQFYQNSIYTVNIDGKIDDDPHFLVTQKSNMYDLMFNAGGGSFFIPSGNLKDVFLNENKFFDLMSVKKINDDASGSNEINSRLINYDDENVFVSWSNEQNMYGTLISEDGRLPGKKIKLQPGSLSFFPGKEALSCWIKNYGDTLYMAGYTIYDINFNERLNKTLHSSTTRLYMDPSALVISDSSFIILYDTGDELKLSKEGKTGITILEKIISQNSLIYDRRMFLIDKNTFWVLRNNILQKFSFDLKVESKAKEFVFNPEYLGDDRFLLLYYEYINAPIPYYSGKVYGTIVNSEKDTTISEIILRDDKSESGSPGYDKIVVKRFPDQRFLVINNYNNKYYGSLFSNDGVALKDSFIITPSDGANIDMAVNGDKVFFTWSDTRNTGKGYDVYGNIYNLTSITSVKEFTQSIPEDYSLSQNYPNPFNPETNFEFRVANSGLVTLKVYDVLGNEVAAIVNRELSPGVYQVSFSASSARADRSVPLASGVYFYQLKAGKYSETKKMILMK